MHSDAFDACKRDCLRKMAEADKSPKGGLDAPIISMIHLINRHVDYVTTSSCSGRVALFAGNTDDASTADGDAASNMRAVSDGVDEHPAQAPSTAEEPGAAGGAPAAMAAAAAAAPAAPAAAAPAAANKGGVWLLAAHHTVTVDDVAAALASAPVAAPSANLVLLKHEPFVMHVQCRTLEAARRLLLVAIAAGFRESGITPGAKKLMVALRTTSNVVSYPLVLGAARLYDGAALAAVVPYVNSRFDSNRRRTCRLEELLGAMLAGGSSSSAAAAGAAAGTGAGGSGGGAGGQVAAAGTGAKGGEDLVMCAVVRASLVKQLKVALEGAGFLDKTRRVVRCPEETAAQVRGAMASASASASATAPPADGGEGLFALPLTADGVQRLPLPGLPGSRHAASGGGSDVAAALPPALAALLSHCAVASVSAPLSKVALASRGGATTRALQQVALKHGVPAALLELEAKGGQARGGSAQAAAASAAGQRGHGVPRKWETVGDVLMVPAHAFREPAWAACGDDLWAALGTARGCGRVARKAEIDPASVLRESQVALLWVSEAAAAAVQAAKRAQKGVGWVDVRENGLTYSFDLTKVMFSSGNVTEKRRMAAQRCAGETVVDLFSGIGYYTVPLLAHAGAAHVHACEWNPNSVAALRVNLAQNGGLEAAGRCTVHVGDNQLTAPALRGQADRVLLGLLPSSEASWPLAVNALRPGRGGGGWLHVHENVATAERGAWVERLLATLEQLAAARRAEEEAGQGEGGQAWEGGEPWVAHCAHIERVKSYAPRVDHIVVDVLLGPPPAA